MLKSTVDYFGGGLLVDASLALQQHITDNLFIELGGGYVTAPDGDFRATSLNAKLGYSYSMLDLQDDVVFPGSLADYNQHNMRIRLVHQTYLENDPQWRNHHANLDVNLLGFQGDYFLTERFYLSGQGISAYQGQAGGYMTGLIGGGLVWQGNVGLGYRFSGPYSLIASYGRIQAAKGNFKAHVLGLSLAYHFAFFAR